jgi:tRNA nucleotidyltransferase (CCA-adding enzyme)
VTAPELEVYLVGGAVRDKLLGYPVHEQDWVVVGARPEQLLDLGYRQVGKDFPVFLHPDTGEEYALARTERKSGHGYTGFAVNSDPAVTLEEDLSRRDLTVNAIAEDRQGRLIDPYGGQRDLQERLLRHVSPAFVEDPLRVLRVARFAARYAHLGFTVAPDTMTLMRQISCSGELLHLAAERVWQELERGLGETSPQQMLLTLQDCGALQALFPEWRLEPTHLETLQRAAELSTSTAIRFAALTAALEPETLRQLCQRLRAPNAHQELALLCCLHAEASGSSEAADILALFDHTDAWRRPERFADFLLACAAICQLPRKQGDRLRLALQCCQHIDSRRWREAGLNGPEIGARIRSERLRIMEGLDAE